MQYEVSYKKYWPKSQSLNERSHKLFAENHESGARLSNELQSNNQTNPDAARTSWQNKLATYSLSLVISPMLRYFSHAKTQRFWLAAWQPSARSLLYSLVWLAWLPFPGPGVTVTPSGNSGTPSSTILLQPPPPTAQRPGQD